MTTSQPDAPLCPHCTQPMPLHAVSPSGSRSYFCGCRPGGYWHTEHKIVDQAPAAPTTPRGGQ